MGDISTETSMEDILSSIKRIIAEEGDGAPTPLRGRKSIRAAHAAPREEDIDEVLELREAVEPAPRPIERAQPRIAAPEAEPAEPAEPDEAPEPAAAAEPAASEPLPEPRAPEPAPQRESQPEMTDPAILSARTAEASRAKLDALSRMMVKPDAPGADSLEGLVREMLRPMLREWLDAKLPSLVESMVEREIARISGRD